MNKFFASVGALTLGATALHAGGVQMMDPTRPYSVSATLRGFYDDNYITATEGGKRDSFGIAVLPSIAFQVPLEKTTLGLKYTFGARWYEDRKNLNGSSNDTWDYTHELDVFLNHEFNPRYRLDLSDSLVISQEPELLSGGSPYRTEGNNLRNRAEANFSAVLSRQLSLVVGYQNTLVDYENDGGSFLSPSLSGLLDRMAQIGLLNLRW